MISDRHGRVTGIATSLLTATDGIIGTHKVGGQTILELWIPAEDLDELNASIVG